MGRPGKHVGCDGVKDFFAKLSENFEMSGIDVRQKIEKDDTVVFLGWFAGKGRKTGKPASTEFCWVWQVRNGLVDRYQGHFDTAAILAAIS